MAQKIGLHSLKPKPGSRHRKKRVGRGEGSGMGKTSGRGENGAGSRSGAKSRSNFEGGQMPIHMRLPKLKGFRNRFKVTYQVVNLDRLAELFPGGGQVGPAELAAAGAVRPDRPVKVLGDGELGNVSVQVSAHAFSASAKAKLEAAGGAATVIGRAG
jgi:large subunit ribosomal protein L15